MATVAPAAAARAAGFQDPVAAPPTSALAPPDRIRIPSIGVDASLEHLNRDSSGTLLPPHALMRAGWYAAGTVPGGIGPAVIAGHVDWVGTVAVFRRLSELQPGRRIDVHHTDGSTTHFTVTRVRQVSKFHFPTAAVYGPTPDAELRVITCGGPWDDARNIYSDNVVVFATATA